MRTNDENNSQTISENEQLKFADYDFKKVEKSKTKINLKSKHAL